MRKVERKHVDTVWCEQRANLVNASLVRAVTVSNEQGLGIKPNFVATVGECRLGELAKNWHANAL